MLSLSRTRAIDRVSEAGFQPARGPKKTVSCPVVLIASARSACAGCHRAMPSGGIGDREVEEVARPSAWLPATSVLVGVGLATAPSGAVVVY